MEKMIKFNFHSVVDVITNSSTVIYTYQDGCEVPAKELVNEMLNLSGETKKKAEDIFYFGVFCDNYKYTEYIDERMEDDGEELPNFPQLDGRYGTPEYNESIQLREKWIEDLKLSIMKGEAPKPAWMERAEESYDSYRPRTYLFLVPKEEKYTEFGKKIKKLLGGIEADGGYNG